MTTSKRKPFRQTLIACNMQTRIGYTRADQLILEADEPGRFGDCCRYRLCSTFFRRKVGRMRHGGYVYWDSDRTVDVDSYNQRSRVSQRRQGGGGGGGGGGSCCHTSSHFYLRKRMHKVFG